MGDYGPGLQSGPYTVMLGVAKGTDQNYKASLVESYTPPH